MTAIDSADERLAAALQLYAEHPLEDGDAVLFLNDEVCVELEAFTSLWGDPVVRDNVTSMLRDQARRVVLAIARRGADLEPADYTVWRELHQALQGCDVELLSVKALPAAA